MSTRFVQKVSTMSSQNLNEFAKSQLSNPRTEGSVDDESQWTARNGAAIKKKMTKLNVFEEYSPAKITHYMGKFQRREELLNDQLNYLDRRFKQKLGNKQFLMGLKHNKSVHYNQGSGIVDVKTT